MNSGGDGGGTRAAAAAAAAAAGMVGMSRSPFTVSQWQELEHQALIFKYMMAGLPVPPDIVLPIQKSFDSISHRFFHPAMGYWSFYGKKVDPEPGRCRRTDGKKWRCSKDAYPDSKYCERHMHRGRNRSRKPVEPQTMTQPSSSVTSLTATEASPVAGTCPPAFQNLPLNAFPNSQPTVSGTSHSNYQLDSIPFGIPSKDYRYLQGLKPEVGEHSFFTDASCSNRALQMDARVNNIWPMIPSRVSSIPTATSSYNNIMQTEYSTQPSFFNNEYASGVSVQPENHALRPFFDEWPRTRNSWSALDDDGSNQASFSTTQLSISIPMASPDFSASDSRSPHDN